MMLPTTIYVHLSRCLYLYQRDGRARNPQGISGFGADVDEDYAWLAKNVFGANPTIFPEDKFGPADFRWAVGVALSRSFFVDGELRLTPLVDFANHASSRSMLEPNGEVRCMVVTARIQEYSELCPAKHNSAQIETLKPDLVSEIPTIHRRGFRLTCSTVYKKIPWFSSV